MELKYNWSSRNKRTKNSSNRTFMELKYKGYDKNLDKSLF